MSPFTAVFQYLQFLASPQGRGIGGVDCRYEVGISCHNLCSCLRCINVSYFFHYRFFYKVQHVWIVGLSSGSNWFKQGVIAGLLGTHTPRT